MSKEEVNVSVQRVCDHAKAGLPDRKQALSLTTVNLTAPGEVIDRGLELDSWLPACLEREPFCIARDYRRIDCPPICDHRTRNWLSQ
nr:hypothetical protein [Mycolicibacterium hodleri]